MLRRIAMAALTIHCRHMHSCLLLPITTASGASRAGLIARQTCSRGRLLAAHPDGGAQLNSVDEILEGISNKGFSARTVDYDADSDSSSDEFIFVDERAASTRKPGAASDTASGEGSQVAHSREADAGLAGGGIEAGADEEEEPDEGFEAGEMEEEDDDGEDEEPPLPAGLGDGPIIEYSPSTAWAEPALAVAQGVLAQDSMAGLELYSFRAAPVNDRLYMRIDKLEDVYGSPSMEDITAFSREFYAALEARLGEEAAGKLQIEVSSPGAERRVRVPSELLRFQSLPMQVTFQQQGAEGDGVETRVLRLLIYDEAAGTTEWGLADVKVNRQKRLGRMTKKETQLRFNLPLAALRHVNLHLDL